MDVDALVDAWKAQMHTGPKHGRDSDTKGDADQEAENAEHQRKQLKALKDDQDTEGDSDQEAENAEHQRKQLKALKDDQERKYTLRDTRGQLLGATQKLKAALRRFECKASLPWIKAMLWHVDHLYYGTFFNTGRWGTLIRVLSGNLHADREMMREDFPVFISCDQQYSDPYGLRVPIQSRSDMYTAVEEVYDFVQQTLLDNNFIAKRPPSPLAAQDPYADESYGSAGDDDDEENGPSPGRNGDGDNDCAVDDDARSDAMSDAVSPRPDPVAHTYEQLFEFCIDVLPDNINLAKEYLSTEDHSMFSHSYDYLLEFNQEGGAIQIPKWRSYFYRGASEDPSQQSNVSPANRNADIAALFRSMVLWSVVLASEAKNDAVCPIAARLNAVRGEGDGRYKSVIEQIRRLHSAMLSRGKDMGSQTTAERYATYESFVAEYAPSVMALTGPLDDYDWRGTTRPSDSSPLVDLLVRVCEVGLALMAARYASGMTARDERGVRTITPSQMVPFPTPVFRKFQVVVVQTTDETEPDGQETGDGDYGDDEDNDASDGSVISEILEIAELEEEGEGTDIPGLQSRDDSQETIVDGDGL
jgi:hypothetical protein